MPRPEWLVAEARIPLGVLLGGKAAPVVLEAGIVSVESDVPWVLEVETEGVGVWAPEVGVELEGVLVASGGNRKNTSDVATSSWLGSTAKETL